MQRLMGCICLMLRLWQRHCKFKSRDLISDSKKNSNALNFPQLLNYWTDSATRKRLNCVVHESESEHYRTMLHDDITWSYFGKLTTIQSSKELTKNYVKTFERCSRCLFVELQRDWQCSLSQVSRRMCRTEMLADLWRACQFANGCGGWAAWTHNHLLLHCCIGRTCNYDNWVQVSILPRHLQE